MSLTAAFRRLGPSPLRSKPPLPPTGFQIESADLLLRIGQPRDWQAWRDLRSKSQDFLKPWEPTWPPEALTFDYYSSSLRRQWREWKEGKTYTFMLFLKENAEASFAHFGQRGEMPPSTSSIDDKGFQLIGGITLSHIERNAAQNGQIGYWIGLPYARKGFMTTAAKRVETFAFETLRLHRLEANCMPSNEPSKRLLTKLGFHEEGTAKSYLRINGAWEDHLLWGKINQES